MEKSKISLTHLYKRIHDIIGSTNEIIEVDGILILSFSSKDKRINIDKLGHINLTQASDAIEYLDYKMMTPQERNESLKRIKLAMEEINKEQENIKQYVQ